MTKLIKLDTPNDVITVFYVTLKKKEFLNINVLRNCEIYATVTNAYYFIFLNIAILKKNIFFKVVLNGTVASP